jgi:type III secretion protein U
VSGEKTEKPTQKKLDDARKKGQVSVSKDAQILFKLLMFYMFFFWLSQDYAARFSELLDLIVTAGLKQPWTFSESIFSMFFDLFVAITVPLVAVCAIAATLITWAQIGFLVSPEALTPSFKKFDAVSNIKNMFSKKSLVQLLLSIVKVLILSVVGYLVFKDNMGDMIYSYRAGLTQFFDVLVHVLKAIIFVSLIIFMVIAVIDWSVEYMHHIKNLRMSHQDIADERKQSMGNPQLKQRMKREHRSILNSSLTRVAGAKAIVANPTHISVALDYEPGKHDLPYILAMGTDDEALRIREFAKKNGIPIIVNVKLARMLYQDCEEDEYIQKEHLELAAQVFRAVMEMASDQDKGVSH